MQRDKSSQNYHLVRFFGRNVRAIIKERRMPQRALAEAIGEKYTTLNHWLTGAAMPSAVGAVKIADCLRVSLDDLHGRDAGTAERLRQICDYAERIKELAQHGHGPRAERAGRATPTVNGVDSKDTSRKKKPAKSTTGKKKKTPAKKKP